MVYPAMIFGYALMEESRPGKDFWKFILIYTQVIIILQFLTQLNIWDNQNKNISQDSFGLKIIKFSELHNIGLIRIQNYNFRAVLQNFYSEILVIAFVLIHI